MLGWSEGEQAKLPPGCCYHTEISPQGSGFQTTLDFLPPAESHLWFL